MMMNKQLLRVSALVGLMYFAAGARLQAQTVVLPQTAASPQAAGNTRSGNSAAVAPTVAGEQSVAGRKNSAASQSKPYLIMISLDGFRSDYAVQYKARNLLGLSQNGIRAKSMFPSYPSKTFPNHYSIITGLYPAHHGIVDNRFYDASRRQEYSLSNKVAVRDGSWYGGTPLWVLAEKQQLLSASYYWVGSEADIQHTRPTYYFNYADTIPIGVRIQKVIDWLTLAPAKRPHLITFYMPEVDHAGHTFGPGSDKVRQAVHFADSAIGVLARRVDSLKLDMNYIVVSDHGMAGVNRVNEIPISIDSLGITNCKVYGAETQLNLYFSREKEIIPVFNHLKELEGRYTVYLKRDVPARFHYGMDDDKFNRIGEIVLIARFPNVFGSQEHRGPLGTHGFDPRLPEMGAVFYAWGPAFKSGMVIPSFENVNVFPLAAEILKLKVTEPIDGQLSVLKNTLK